MAEIDGRNNAIFGTNTMCYKIIRENGISQMHTLYCIYNTDRERRIQALVGWYVLQGSFF